LKQFVSNIQFFVADSFKKAGQIEIVYCMNELRELFSSSTNKDWLEQFPQQIDQYGKQSISNVFQAFLNADFILHKPLNPILPPNLKVVASDF
jgi:hypothetical protein